MASPTGEDAKDAQALLHVEPIVIHGASELKTPWDCMRNFILMSFSFAVCFGTVTALVSFASSVFACEPSLANMTGAAMWGCFSLSGLFISKPVVNMLGAKLGMALGLTLNCVNAGMFAVAHATVGENHAQDDKACKIDAWVMTSMILSSAMAGTGCGIMWTAQGKFFQLSALLYSKQTGKGMQEVLNQFTGIFSGCLLGSEFVIKLLLSLIPLEGPSAWVSMTILACVSTIGMGCITDLYTDEDKATTWYSRVTAASRFLCSDRRIWMALMFPMTFGFGTAYSAYSINKGIVTDGPGIEYLGYTMCIMVGAAVVVSQFYTQCHGNTKHGVRAFFVILVLWAMTVAIAGYSNLRSWPAIVLVVVLFGTARGLYESAGRAWLAEYFPSNIESAFALWSFMNGAATSLALLARQFLPEWSNAAGIAVAGVAGVLLCEAYLQHEATAKE